MEDFLSFFFFIGRFLILINPVWNFLLILILLSKLVVRFACQLKSDSIIIPILLVYRFHKYNSSSYTIGGFLDIPGTKGEKAEQTQRKILRAKRWRFAPTTSFQV